MARKSERYKEYDKRLESWNKKIETESATASTRSSRLTLDYTFKRVVGSGTFGTIYKVEKISSREQRVVKIYKYNDKDSKNELAHLSEEGFSHPNIIIFYECWVEDRMKIKGTWANIIASNLPPTIIISELELCDGMLFLIQSFCDLVKHDLVNYWI